MFDTNNCVATSHRWHINWSGVAGLAFAAISTGVVIAWLYTVASLLGLAQ